MARALKDLGAAIGKQRVATHPLNEITRADANALRDYLLERMKPSSVHRYITVVRAAVNYVITSIASISPMSLTAFGSRAPRQL